MLIPVTKIKELERLLSKLELCLGTGLLDYSFRNESVDLRLCVPNLEENLRGMLADSGFWLFGLGYSRSATEPGSRSRLQPFSSSQESLPAGVMDVLVSLLQFNNRSHTGIPAVKDLLPLLLSLSEEYVTHDPFGLFSVVGELTGHVFKPAVLQAPFELAVKLRLQSSDSHVLAIGCLVCFIVVQASIKPK